LAFSQIAISSARKSFERNNVPVLVSVCHHELERSKPSSRTVPTINGTRPPAPCDSRLAGRSPRMPSGPSRTGRKGNNSMAEAAFRLARRSDESAEMRQGNVLFGEAVAQDRVLLAKRIQEGVARKPSKTGRVEPVPDWKIYDLFHHEMRHCVHSAGGECVRQLWQQRRNFR
jgi:hypothetical protein